ncbi:MAG: vWA domain-containing protein [Polyangiaceae bacterium]
MTIRTPAPLGAPSRVLRRVAPVLAIFAVAACSAAPSSLDDDGDGSTGSAGSRGRQGTSDAGFGGTGASAGSGGMGGTGGSGGDGTCAATTVSATKPAVDIVFAIDQSGSMDNEIAKVKANINAFAQKIGTSGLDYQVIMIATKAGENGICVPEPLAGPACADNGSKFHQVDRRVDSHNAMPVIVDSYDHAWKQWARKDALKAIVVITDDESNASAELFDLAMVTKADGMFGTAGARKYVYNAICGWKEGTPVPGSTKCAGTADAGKIHQQAAVMTGGLVESLCKDDYAAVLDNVAKKVGDRLACEFAMPVASGTQTVDPTKIAVKLTAGGAAEKLLTQVTDASKCAQVPDAWFYDDNTKPTRIQLCPTTCDTASKEKSAKVDVALGCKVPTPR